MKKKIIVASVFTVALIGGIIGIKSVSGGHHTSGAETKIVQKTTIQETTTAVQHETKAPVETKKKVDLIFPEKYKNVSAIKIEKKKVKSEDDSDEMVEIYEKDDEKSKVVGIGVDGSYVKILKKGKKFYKIKSDKITGYVKKENVVTGKKAKEVLIEAKDVIVKVKAKKTELRSEDSKKSKVLSNLQEKAEYPITDISKDKKWIKVERTSTMSGWVKTKDITVKIHKEYLYTPEEYDDMLEQEWAANAITYTLEETSLPKEGEAAEFLKYATQFLGNRYVWGGTSLTSGADCSGFTMSLFKKFGYSLSRTAAEQAHNGKAVKSNKLKPGDLVFYHTDRKNKNRISHVAIYIGDGKILHSANKTQGVIISRLGNPCAARRILSGKSVRKDKDKDKDKEKTAVVSTKKDIKRLNQETTTEEESTTMQIETTTKVPRTMEVETTTKVEETESCTDE